MSTGNIFDSADTIPLLQSNPLAQPSLTVRAISCNLMPQRPGYWDVQTHAFRVEHEPISLMIGDSSADIALKTTIQVE